MPYRNSLLVLILISVAACSPPSPGPESTAGAGAAAATGSAPDGWITLFDGSSLARWNPIGDANWELVDGSVRANSGAGFLVSDQSYEDFDLALEFWVTPDANSGIFSRCMNPQEVSDTSCYEANIYDRRPDPMYRTGGIVNVAAPMSTLNAGGRWNSYEIAMIGSQLRVTLNDVVTVDVIDDTLSGGPIALQYGAGTVMFRNVKIRPR
jgi:hypothetical protein